MSEHSPLPYPEPTIEDLKTVLYELADTPGSAITDELRQYIQNRRAEETAE